jgi:TPR repeat protein
MLWPMKTCIYTKGVLTVIALLLAVIAVKRLISPDTIAAAQGSNGQKSSPAVGISADEALISAKKYYALQQYSQALPLFVKAAEAGNGEAAVYLGFMYANGQGGLPKDEAQAVSWYRKAADAGDAQALAALKRLGN